LTLTSPAYLQVASEFAPRYVNIVRGFELIVSFMTVAEMRQGALDANWEPRKCAVLEAYLADFSALHSDSLLCSTWAAVRNESTRKGAGPLGTAGDEQSQGLPPFGPATDCFCSPRMTLLYSGDLAALFSITPPWSPSAYRSCAVRGSGAVYGRDSPPPAPAPWNSPWAGPSHP
jgi:hypothetical protein